MGLFDKRFKNKDSKRTSPEMILESRSPSCPLVAFVEQDNRTAYFYVVGTDTSDPNTRVCWVRNTSTSDSDDPIKAQMQAGAPPMVPRAYISDTAERAPLDPKHLSIVWFEEGDAAALLLYDSVIAVVPSWSGTNGFHGYAKDCAKECDVCWPLSENNFSVARTKKAQDFWRRSGSDGYWKETQEQFLNKYQETFGKVDKYYAIDGGKWPPRALVSIPLTDGTVYVTLGVSTLCQPSVEMATEEPEKLRRFELGFFASNEVDSQFVQRMVSYIGGQASLPWDKLTWLGNGHTIGCWALDALGDTSLSAVLLSKTFGYKELLDMSIEGDPVNLLWLVPISTVEREFAGSNGSERLLEVLNERGVSPAFRPRDSML